MSTSISQAYAASPTDDSHDLDSDDGVAFDDNDDDDNLDLEEADLLRASEETLVPEDDLELDDVPAPPYYPGVNTCIVCRQRPPYSKGGKSYPTCGLKCAAILENIMNQNTPPPSRGSPSGRGGSSSYRGAYHARGAAPPNGGLTHNAVLQSPTTTPISSVNPNIALLSQHLGGHTPSPSPSRPRNVGKQPQAGGSRIQGHANRSQNATVTMYMPPSQPSQDPCVICLVKPCHDSQYVTCGLKCAEKLCKGGGNLNMCDYCHRRPKIPGHNQCGKSCRDSAKIACLLCKSRPKFRKYHLCGKTCKQIAVKSTPLLLEAPNGHTTYELVESKFKSGWKGPTPQAPTIKKVYKIIENKNFLQPYDRYKKSVGNEVFRYHGTTRKCTLGSAGNTQLCNDNRCPLCSILRTSFKTSLANPSGAFGPGIYSSSAANKAFSYSGNGSGAVLLTKVILGKARSVNGWNEVMSCPPGFNSVVFDRQNGALNETIVYSDDAIRPVFLIIFK